MTTRNKIRTSSLLLRCLFFCALLAVSTSASYGQIDPETFDFTKVEVDELSDAQIQQVLDMAKERGLTLDDLEQIARARGVSASEIRKFRTRALEVRSGSSQSDRPEQSWAEERPPQLDPADLLRQSRQALQSRMAGSDTAGTSSRPRRIFGENLFNTASLTFAPSLNIPTPQNYQLGPGDELIISVWGAAEEVYRIPVDRDGTVRIENLGPTYVNGLTIEEAEERLLSRLSQLYAGLNASEPSALNTYADVTLGRLRTISVHILGEVNVPGTYELPSLSTVFNALYVCAGPNENGTYRHIQVIRGDRIVGELDVYDFLVYGSQKGNIRLRDQDILKVDPYMARVEITGEVKRPAVFEIKAGETLSDLLRFAGSFTERAYTRRLKVYRNTPTEKRLLDVVSTEFNALRLHNGDRIFVGEILDRFENRVEIQGAVYRGGEYELGDVETVYNLIQRAEGLKGDAFTSRAHIRRTREDRTVELVPFDLARVMRDPSQYDIPLQKDDVVIIPSLTEMREDSQVAIEGSVQKPGAYPYLENMTLQDLILMAGGFRSEASLLRVEVARRRTNQRAGNVPSQIAEIDTFELDKDLALDAADTRYRLQPFDEVFVRKSPSYIAQRNVVLTGEVMYPGTYTIENKADRISDMIDRAGGLTREAYPKGARLIRTHNAVGPVGINLEQILQRPHGLSDLLVEAGDSIHIPLRLETVKVTGAVYAPANIRYAAGMSLMDYINRSGGPTDQADLSKAYIIYANGSVDRIRMVGPITFYPDIEPGAEIIVPIRPEERKMSAGERITVLSTVVSMAAVVSTTIIQLLRL